MDEIKGEDVTTSIPTMERESIAERSGNTGKIAAVVFGRNRNKWSRLLVMWVDR